MNWKTEKRKISELKQWDKNPRNITEKGLIDLGRSIDKFNLADPIIINTDGTIIGGHARYISLVKRGVKECDCRIPDKTLTEKQVEELNIRLNKNIAGEFDFDKLANGFEVDDLIEYGFSELELGLGADIECDDVPDIKDNVDMNECPKCGYKWQDLE